jgi:osmotically-inducible protein OsmY
MTREGIPREIMTRNDYLIAHIREALAHSPDVGALDVQVEVADEMIFLSGTIDCHAKRAASTRVAQEVAPEHRVINNMSVLELQPSDTVEVLHDPSGGHR